MLTFVHNYISYMLYPGLDLREGVATGIRVRFRSGRKAEVEAEIEEITGKMTERKKRRKLHQLCPERSQKRTLAFWVRRLEVLTSRQLS